MMDQPNIGFSQVEAVCSGNEIGFLNVTSYASYVTLDMQIIYLFAIRSVRSIVRMFDGRGTVFS